MLTPPDHLPYTAAQLTIVGPSISAIIVGSTKVVSPGVETQLTVGDRYGGADRYETCAKVLYAFAPTFLDPPIEELGVATGENFPDALAAGPYLAARGSWMMLVQRDGVPDAIWDWLLHADYDPSRPGPTINGMTIFGSTSAVSSACEAELAPLIW